MIPAPSVGINDHQNLAHVLNSCRVARDLRQYNKRYDAVLAVLYEVVKKHLPDTTLSIVDLTSTEYSFPCHIVASDLRPDIIYWDETTKKESLIELTVRYDTLFEGAIRRKEERYQKLLDTFQDAGYTASLVTVEVGSRGIPIPAGFLRLIKSKPWTLQLHTSQPHGISINTGHHWVLQNMVYEKPKADNTLNSLFLTMLYCNPLCNSL